MKIKINFIRPVFIGAIFIYLVIILISCNGCKSKQWLSESKGKTSNLIESDITIDKNSNLQTSTTINTIPISLRKVDYNDVDEYNVRRQILDFRNPTTGEIIKSIDLVKENPYIKAGFNRRKEPDPDEVYFLQMKGNERKNQIKEFIPKSIYDNIPSGFIFQRAKTQFIIDFATKKYVVVSFILDWNENAYGDNYEISGNGYAVSNIIVWDSIGNKIYEKQFDGYVLQTPGISIDGEKLALLSCLTPEDKLNKTLQLSIVEIKSNHTIYEEMFENTNASISYGGLDNRNKLFPHFGFGINFQNGDRRILIAIDGAMYEFKDAKDLDSYTFLENKNLKLFWINGTESEETFEKQLKLIKTLPK